MENGKRFIKLIIIGQCIKTAGNSGFEQWLVLSFLGGNYKVEKLFIFRNNYKKVATAQSRGTLCVSCSGKKFVENNLS